MSKKGRVFCSFDWHGCGKVANQVLDWLSPEDTLYFGGDAIDRGPDGIEILNRLAARPNTILMRGNHEEMMARAIPYIIEDIKEYECFYDWTGYLHWFQNGGKETAKAFLSMTEKQILKYKELIENMPTEIRYKSPNGHTVVLEHAGYTPVNIQHRSHDPLWDREHFYDRWNNGWEIEPGSNAEKIYLVHGHTPVQYMRLMFGYDGMEPLTANEMKHKTDWYEHKDTIKPEVIRYCSGHKFNLDLCTIVSHRIALLDLDTFETIYFDEEEY